MKPPREVNRSPVIRPTTRPRRVAQAFAGDADHDKSPSMGLVITDGTNNYPLPAGRPSIGSPPTRPQLPCDGCGEPKGQEETLVVTFGLCALALPMLAAGQINVNDHRELKSMTSWSYSSLSRDRQHRRPTGRTARRREGVGAGNGRGWQRQATVRSEPEPGHGDGSLPKR